MDPGRNAMSSTGTFSSAAGVCGLLALAAAPLGLYLLSRVNYLLFHGLVEVFSVVVACGVFMIAWNSRRFHENGFFLALGIASLFVAGVDFLHAMAYQGMGVFPGRGANLATQLWLVARYLGAAGFLLALYFVNRRPRPTLLFGGYLAATLLLLTAVFAGVFPVCFRPASGLTPFKIDSEYLVCLLLAGALLLLRRRRRHFAPEVLQLLHLSIGAFILSELAFTLYTDAYGLANVAGHLFKVASFYFLYRGMIVTGLTRPYDLLFRELKESEERYRILYEQTPVMLFSLDRQGRVVRVSDYWLEYLGFARDEVLGRPITQLFPPSAQRRAEETFLSRLLRTGACQDLSCRILKKDGTSIDVLLSAVAKGTPQGEEGSFLAVMIDVTAQLRYQEEIEHLNAELQQRAAELENSNLELEAFNYSVSHDLRGPLTGISSQCQLLLEVFAEGLDGRVRTYLQGIYAQTLRMNELIDTLLGFARLSKVALDRQRIDLSTMARSIAGELALHDPARQVRFTIADGLESEGDPSLLRIMLENLLGNAWKYTAKTPEARIEIGRREAGERQVLFVRDNGAGFDAAAADELFTPFKRLHGPGEFAGFGVGLATVRRILERHGGSVWAQGSPGAGATFFFTL